ncbi:uncharacterized protein LOC113378505 [Ctenocephalides felis]|uniref:uncharacterized protein LOC113378505 n=1 Tax=Ctenocephalides felis TaxID=7515 RepID=UPI000E6E31FC|nr:uncharacterized protein LOC113378505 [Ctenocephalides felis]
MAFLLTNLAQSWTSYKLNLEYIRVAYYNKEFVDLEQLEIVKVNRTYRYFIAKGRSLKTVNTYATNYKIVFQSLRLAYHNPEYVDVKNFEVQRVNRTYSFLHVNVVTKKIVNSAVVQGQLYKQMSNRYKEHFRPLTSDFCSLFSGINNSKLSGMSGQLMATLLKPLHKAFNSPGQQLPKGCPIPPGPIVMKFSANEDDFPGFLFPEGKWMLKGNITDGATLLFNTSMYFDIRTFLSEKQKKILG